MNIDQLNELSIFALRNLARKTGVYAPTSKKKGELITEIIAISEGKKDPYVPKTKQGRPPKSMGYAFTDVSIPAVPFEMQNSSQLSFKQNFKFCYDDLETIQGYVEKVGYNGALLWIRNDIKFESCYIPNAFVTKYALRTGDLLLTKIGLSDNQLVVKDIFNINRCPINKFNSNRVDFVDIPHIGDGQKILFANPKFDELNIVKGDNILLKPKNQVVDSNALLGLLNQANIANKIYINISLTNKNKEMVKPYKNIEHFVADFAEDGDILRRIVSITTERVKRLVEKGEDVLVLIDDLVAISNLDPDMKMAKNIVTLAKNSKDASVTIIAVSSADYRLNVFDKVADKLFVIDKDEITRS